MNLLYQIGATLVAAGAAFGIGYTVGHTAGEDARAVADQAQFDARNAALTRQKAEANTALEGVLIANAAEAASQASNLHSLETKNAQDLAATRATFARGATRQLYIRVPARRCGDRSGGTTAAQAPAPSPPPTSDVELPAETARRVLAVGLDADTLADNYRLCYRFVVGDSAP